jgi:hypothetical protein
MHGDRKAAFRSQHELLVEHLQLKLQGSRTPWAGSQFDAPLERLIEDPTV